MPTGIEVTRLSYHAIGVEPDEVEASTRGKARADAQPSAAAVAAKNGAEGVSGDVAGLDLRLEMVEAASPEQKP